MKKTISIIAAFCILGLSACSDNKQQPKSETKNTQNVATQVASESSCHTCFDYKPDEKSEKPKQERSKQYRFALNNVTIYSKDGSEAIGQIVKGFGGEEIGSVGDKVILKVMGYQKEGDNNTLYVNESLNLPALSFNDSVSSNELEVAILKTDITDQEGDVWSQNEFIYYDNCSMCHAAHAPKSHTIQEWEGIYGTMKVFAMPTDHDDKLIWQYLQAHAKDGFAVSE